MGSFEIRRKDSDSVEEGQLDKVKRPVRENKPVNSSARARRQAVEYRARRDFEARDTIADLGNFLARPQAVDRVPFMPCTHCDVYIAVRCELWRLSVLEEADNALFQALKNRNHSAVEQWLGLSGGWEILQFRAVSLPGGTRPLEAAGGVRAFRYHGYPWNQDPVMGNSTAHFWDEMVGASARGDLGDDDFNVPGMVFQGQPGDRGARLPVIEVMGIVLVLLAFGVAASRTGRQQGHFGGYESSLSRLYGGDNELE